ncbi:hypothetical protein [Vibrio campbellii]|uniref:hypothetical protein n=1 Tax=Vibrio campbellii TaxID=680 RepID=UPI0005EE4969|nr:hypothetical protein [Vibrio campbellii]
MLNHKEKDIVIDGVPSSEVNAEMRVASVYIASLIIADTKGILEDDIRKIILKAY